MSDDHALQGQSIVVTRPKHQAAAIIGHLQKRGAEVINFPLLAITEPQNAALSQKQLSSIFQYDFLIFTSPNAVEKAFKKISASMISQANVAAVGKKTAEMLKHYGVNVAIVPEKNFNSEALLACRALQSVQTANIAIIRGEGGRELLRDTLLRRGAQVDYIDVYRRICPAENLLPLVKFQQQGSIDIIILTSVESLQHFFRLGAGLAWVNQVTLLVGSERIREHVRHTSHVGNVLVAADPSDGSIIQCLMSWIKDKKP